MIIAVRKLCVGGQADRRRCFATTRPWIRAAWIDAKVTAFDGAVGDARAESKVGLGARNHLKEIA